MEEKEEKRPKTSFERFVLPVLKYVGAIGAILMCIAYMVVVFVLVEGFKQNELKSDLIFALVNAAVGFIIMQFLKVQGISFAKNLDDNKTIINEYYNSKTKDKKTRSIKYYWIISLIKDFFIKAICVFLCTVGLVYIVIQGTHDYMLILLAVVNLILFICFGLLSLNSAYEFYNNRHIPYLKEQIKNKEKEKCLDAKTQSIETCKSKSKKTKKTLKTSLTKKQS